MSQASRPIPKQRMGKNTQNLRQVRRFSATVRISCLLMGAILVVVALTLWILAPDHAESRWLGLLSLGLGAPLIYTAAQPMPRRR